MAAVALGRMLEVETDRALAVVRLSARGLVALFEIGREPALTQEQLARRLCLTASATSELLARLERRGLVARNPKRRGGVRRHPADACAARRREGVRPLRAADRVVVELTKAGRDRLARAEAITGRLEDRWAARLTVPATKGPPRELHYGLARWLREGLDALAAPRS